MSRNAKATLELKPNGRDYGIELRPEAGPGRGVRLELHRDDCYAGPVVLVSLDEAQVFLRRWQAAVDEAYRREKEAFTQAARELQP